MKLRWLWITLFWSGISFLASAQRPEEAQKRLGDVLYQKVKDQLDYFPYDSSYRVLAHFDPSISNGEPFQLPVTAGQSSYFKEFGSLHFTLPKGRFRLTVFRPWPATPLNRHVVFVPFRDLSSQNATYPAGRYLPISMDDMTEEGLWIDFNAATNPLCAYDDTYACPLPPKQNHLAVAIPAGEKRPKAKPSGL